MTHLAKPSPTEFNAYYQGYINLVENEPISCLSTSSNDFVEMIDGLSETDLDFAYGDGKWTIKEVIGHIIDCELVFLYRALTVSRQDKTSLPGFEQNDWLAASNYNRMSKSQLINLFKSTRECTLAHLEAMENEMFPLTGIANGHPISVRAIIYILAGHHLHHQNIIRLKYLTALKK